MQNMGLADEDIKAYVFTVYWSGCVITISLNYLAVYHSALPAIRWSSYSRWQWPLKLLQAWIQYRLKVNDYVYLIFINLVISMHNNVLKQTINSRQLNVFNVVLRWHTGSRRSKRFHLRVRGFDSRYGRMWTSTLWRKSWVFSGCSGFLPQG